MQHVRVDVDNSATVAMLETVAPVMPHELQAAFAQLTETADGQAGDSSEEVEAERNDRLRELPAEAIDALPETEEVGSPGLARFAAENRDLLAADVLIGSDGPRLHRTNRRSSWGRAGP